jgi:hypothetical protein
LIAAVVTIQARRISRLKSQNEVLENEKVQFSIEHDYIPQKLDKLTTDELSEMGGVIWEK